MKLFAYCTHPQRYCPAQQGKENTRPEQHSSNCFREPLPSCHSLTPPFPHPTPPAKANAAARAHLVQFTVAKGSVFPKTSLLWSPVAFPVSSKFLSVLSVGEGSLPTAQSHPVALSTSKIDQRGSMCHNVPLLAFVQLRSLPCHICAHQTMRTSESTSGIMASRSLPPASTCHSDGLLHAPCQAKYTLSQHRVLQHPH